METNEQALTICPHCGGDNCFVESYETEGNIVTSNMCMDCGYTTTTLNEEGSPLLTSYEEVTPQLMIDLKWVDPKTKLVWYPIVLNFPSTGIVFPDGTSVLDWHWTAAPAVDIPQEEQSKYPIPNQPGKFYEKRVAMEKANKFSPDEFKQACKSIGLLQES